MEAEIVGKIVKLIALELVPLTVIRTEPVAVPPEGTRALIVASFQDEIEAEAPLIVTVPAVLLK